MISPNPGLKAGTGGAAAAALPANASYGDVLNNLINSIQAPNPNLSPTAAMAAANQANAARGRGILQLLSTQGQTAMANNQQAYGNELGQIQNDMVSKGLAGTSIGDSLNLGAAKNLALENNQVQENVAQQVANMANSFSQQAPNIGLLASLLQHGGGQNMAAGSGPVWNVPGGGALNGPSNLASQGFQIQGATTTSPASTVPFYGGTNNNGQVSNPNGSIAGGSFDPYSVPMQAPAASYNPSVDANPFGAAFLSQFS